MEGFSKFLPCDDFVTEIVTRFETVFKISSGRSFSDFKPTTYAQRNEEGNTHYIFNLELGDGIKGEFAFLFNSETDEFVRLMKTSIEGDLGEMDT